MLAGDEKGRHAELVFSPSNSAANALIIRTIQAGAPGSRLAISAGRRNQRIFDHILTAEECRFDDTGGSRCEVAVSGKSSAYKTLARAFARANSARLTVENAGVMAMSEPIGITGFAQAFGRR